MEPTQDELNRVFTWYFNRRDQWAQKMGVHASKIPAMVPWVMDPDYVLTEEDIRWAQNIADERGLSEK